MVKNKAAGKSGKDSDEEEFTVKPKKGGLKKLSKMETEKEEGSEPDAPASPVGEFRIKKKMKKQELREELKEDLVEKNIMAKLKYKLERININLIFSEIIESTYKNEQMMLLVKNALSRGKREITELATKFKKRWISLKNSNLPEQEYRKKEKELQKTERDEILECKSEIYNNLCLTGIKGFESSKAFIARFRKYLEDNNDAQDLQRILGEKIMDLQEQEYGRYKQDILELLDKLLNERTFTEEVEDPQFKNMMDMKDFKKQKLPGMGMDIPLFKPEKNEPEFRTMEKGGPRNMKSSRKKMTCSIGRTFLENDMKVNMEYSSRSWNDFFKITDKDKLLLKKSEIPVINSSAIERSSDEKQIMDHYKKTTALLKELHKKRHELDYKPDYQSLKDMVYITNFYTYNLHSSQKYHEKRPGLEAQEVLNVLNEYS